MVRLTERQLERTAVRTNAAGDREADLRGLALSSLDALGPRFLNNVDVVNVASNALRTLSIGPTAAPLTAARVGDVADDDGVICIRLRVVIAVENQLTHIDPTLSLRCPNIDSLVLDNNSFSSLSRTGAALARFRFLRFVSLIGNPVVSRKHYRLYIIAKCPRLRTLDYQRVLASEREAAKRIFPAAYVEKVVKKPRKKGSILPVEAKTTTATKT